MRRSSRLPRGQANGMLTLAKTVSQGRILVCRVVGGRRGLTGGRREDRPKSDFMDNSEDLRQTPSKLASGL